MSTAVTTPARTYQIDKAHSEATFQVRHLLSNAALETGGFLVGDEVRVSLSIQAVAQ